MSLSIFFFCHFHLHTTAIPLETNPQKEKKAIYALTIFFSIIAMMKSKYGKFVLCI